MSQQIDPSDQFEPIDLTDSDITDNQTPVVDRPGAAAHDHANDHYALLYENQDEQFNAAIPFIQEGLERGEQCLYVVDENTREDVVAAMQARDIDVDAALKSGAFSILSPADTYRRTGEFDQDAMVEFWEDSLEQATDVDNYAGIRAAAEMTWVLEGETDANQLIEYEALLNPLYENHDYTVLCQYNRERFPSDVLYEVIRTHPLLIHENTISSNVYYTPPEEFFGPEQPARDIERMLGTLRERTEAQSEIEQRKEHFERVFESTNDAILIVDPEADEIIDVNPAASEMLGYPYGELLSLAPSDLHPNELEDFRGFIGDVFEDGSGWTDELTCLTKDRGRIPAEISASRMEYNDRPVMLAAVRDISDRRTREQAQRQLYEIAADTDRTFDEKLQAVFELGCERFDIEFGGMARVDVDADLFEVEVMSGEHDYLIPGEQCPLSETYCREPTREDGAIAAITDPVREGFEGKLCYDRFGVRTYLGTYVELDEGHDRTFFFLSNEPRQEDFSEAERTFHRLMGQWVRYELERQQYQQDLKDTIQQLQQSNDRLAQFAYAASHDLQEPLRMVSSYLQLLEDRYKDDLDEEAQEYIDFATGGADRMRAMVDDLLAYSRVEQSDGEFEPTDGETILERVTDDLQVQIGETDAEITVQSLPTVVADTEQLEQLFENLVSNAIKYNESDPPRVEITAEERRDHWEFSVADNGIGIDPDQTDRIFEVFKRLHHDDEYPGTGIGLPLCQEIVDNHGGDIWVETEPGEGSTFFVSLPKQQRE